MPKAPKHARALTDELLHQQFDLIVEAVLKNERCPVCEPYGPLIENAIKRMRDMGWLKWEVSGRGWRQVTILTGVHTNKTTAPHPQGAVAWKDDEGRRKTRPTAALKATWAPSVPRPLTREELER